MRHTVKNIIYTLTALLLVLALTPKSWGQESLNGYLKKTKDNTYLVVNRNSLVKIKNITPDVLAQLNNLKSGDLVSGFGNISESGRSVELSSIDFVGLQRLLGAWQTAEGDIVNFKTFTDVIFNPKISLFSTLNKSSAYTYSLSPYNDSQWILYLTNDEGTFLCTLEIQNIHAIISVIDTVTNATMKTIELTKVFTTRNHR